jgi:hypothetical protein
VTDARAGPLSVDVKRHDLYPASMLPRRSARVPLARRGEAARAVAGATTDGVTPGRAPAHVR